ncbi:MAG: hypothetical protein LBQ54_11135 [Planctomycetaceae bacterium]|nr:hypothetical protein [Planctomycetaceae bacterium]
MPLHRSYLRPPAANARALDPGRLTLTSFGSPPNRKSFHLEAEGNPGCNVRTLPVPKQ